MNHLSIFPRNATCTSTTINTQQGIMNSRQGRTYAADSPVGQQASSLNTSLQFPTKIYPLRKRPIAVRGEDQISQFVNKETMRTNEVVPTGLEPATFRLLAECSNQLSYRTCGGWCLGADLSIQSCILLKEPTDLVDSQQTSQPCW